MLNSGTGALSGHNSGRGALSRLNSGTEALSGPILGMEAVSGPNLGTEALSGPNSGTGALFQGCRWDFFTGGTKLSAGQFFQSRNITSFVRDDSIRSLWLTLRHTSIFKQKPTQISCVKQSKINVTHLSRRNNTNSASNSSPSHSLSSLHCWKATLIFTRVLPLA